MADSVLQKVLAQCRKAMLGGVPLIYIKTDSDIFIRNLILCESDPLVVLLSNGGQQEISEEKKLKLGRPIYELSNEQDRHLAYCVNYEASLPETLTGGLYQMGKQQAEFPMIWTVKMPEGPRELDLCHKRLEQYVAAHENPLHPQYSILQSSAVILYSSKISLSPMLQAYTEFVDVPYPDEEEIRELIKSEAAGDMSIIGNEAYLSALCTDFLGFTAEEIVMTMQRIQAVTPLDDSERVEGLIRERKRQRMEGGILEYCRRDSSIGGMETFRKWLEEQIEPLKNSNFYRRKTGTPPPKGVLLCGIPGCGKSEAAKFTAQSLDLDLLKMDIGSLMDKYQGVSEQKMRDALRMAEAMSPCVLWIDELEKGFSGAGGNGDSDSFKRMFAYMLGWMQDNRKPCFIFATANDIGGLPKEFFRSGRFDALFAVYLPMAEECVKIFYASMEKAQKNATQTEKLFCFEFAKDKKCSSDKWFLNLMNEDLVHQETGRPRIIVGSDIQKMVDMALRKFMREGIPKGGIPLDMWIDQLRETINSKFFSVYGDGEENLDSIAISYCRMLRKGFTPTSSSVLFRKEDYHMENLQAYIRLKQISTADMKKEQKQEHERKLRDNEILTDSVPRLVNQYDKAVYRCLRARINEIAAPLEQYERDSMITR